MRHWQLETQRLQLRQWRAADFGPFAELNSDPVVMEHFPHLLSPEQSDAMASKCQQLIAERGWGFWAVSLKQSAEFIGLIGLHQTDSSLPCYPRVEIGWRLHKQFWGKGYAREGAAEALRFAFDELLLNEVVSFTTVGNCRSRAVMERLGMVNTHNNFKHPKVHPASRHSEHVLYQISRQRYKSIT